MVFVCPYTPNIWKLPNPQKALDRLTDWLGGVLLPEVRARTPAVIDEARTSVDGCSLGGFVGIQVFVRRPYLFAACGSVQAALSTGGTPALADRFAAALAAAGPRPIHLQTSRDDPFRAANVALSRELRRAHVAHELVVLPGPHDQPWLREAGTLEMLLWHDRALPQG
jgi:enterochelin esterase-like enzyme